MRNPYEDDGYTDWLEGIWADLVAELGEDPSEEAYRNRVAVLEAELQARHEEEADLLAAQYEADKRFPSHSDRF